MRPGRSVTYPVAERTLRHMTTAIRVLVVDDEPAVRRGLTMRLMLEADVLVIGEAANGEVALRLAEDLQPDVIVMDVRMPVMDGITATRILAGRKGNVPIIALSLYDDTATVDSTLNAGASAFIPKSKVDSLLVDTIRRCVSRRN